MRVRDLEPPLLPELTSCLISSGEGRVDEFRRDSGETQRFAPVYCSRLSGSPDVIRHLVAPDAERALFA